MRTARLNNIVQALSRLRIVSGTVALYAASMFLAYVFNVSIARLSGPREYGRFIIVWNLIAWGMTIASLGTSVAAVRYIPQYESTGDTRRLGGFLVVSVLTTVAMSTVLGALGVLASILGMFPAVKNLDGMLAPFWILLMVVNLGNLASEVARAAKNPWMALGPQRVMRPAIALAVIAIGVVVGVLPTRISAADIMSALALAGTTALLAQSGYLWKRFARSLRQSKIFEATNWLKVSSHLCLFSTATGGLMQLDTLMAGILLGPAAAGVFGVDYRVGLLMEIPLAIANIVAAPALSSLFAHRNLEEMQRSTTRASLVIFTSSIVVTAVILLFGEPILRLFGNKFVVGLIPLRWIAAAAATSAAFGPVSFLVVITSLQSIGLVVLVITAVIDVTVSILLVPTIGLTGVAIAYFVSNVFRSVALYALLKKKRHVESGIFRRIVRV